MIPSPHVGCGFVVDGERHAIGLLTGDAAVRLDLATGEIAATYGLPPTAHGWSVIKGHPNGFDSPLRAPGYLLMAGTQDTQEEDVLAAAALDFTTGHVRELRRVPVRSCGYTWLTAGAEAALLTSGRSCDETALTTLDRSGARVAPVDTVPLHEAGYDVDAVVLGADDTAVVQRSYQDASQVHDVDLVSVDTAAGEVRWQRAYPYEVVATLVELPPAGAFEGRLLARTVEDGNTMLDADTGEVLETWADDTPVTNGHHLVGWYDSAAYWIEGGTDSEAAPWRLSWLDPRTLRPADTPLFEMSGAAPEPVAAEGNYLFVHIGEMVIALTATASPQR